MKKIMILSNDHSYTYNLRKEIIQKLIDKGYQVYIVLPYGEKVDLLVEMGCIFIDIEFNGRGKNPLQETKLIKDYFSIIKKIQPDAVLSYTIKPNLYGGIVCRRYNIPFFPNITGLGTAIENESLLQKALIQAYKISFKDVACVFFQNEYNMEVFNTFNINVKRSKLIPGSGINTTKFTILEYPDVQDKIKFIFISRIMKDKGIEEYLGAAKYIKAKYPNTEFHICGFLDGDYKEILNKYEASGIITYHGMIDDVREILKETHCTVHPSYHEGLSNVLLESAASGRPVLASDIPGCRETFNEGISGFGFEARDTQSLIDTIEKFLQLSNEEMAEMGLNGRNKVENEFDRQIVVDKYMEEIEIAVEGK